jgi:uncharacterized protein (DUF3820 family)
MEDNKMTDTSLMPWGKYKNKRLIDIPASYFIWLWDEWEYKNPVNCIVD